MKFLAALLQFIWLLVSVAPLVYSLLLRRASLKLAAKSQSKRYFEAQGKAWEGNATEIVSAIVRGFAGFALPDHPIVVVLLLVGIVGRIHQIIRLNSAYNSIVNGN
jgi:hypothetical protein